MDGRGYRDSSSNECLGERAYGRDDCDWRDQEDEGCGGGGNTARLDMILAQGSACARFLYWDGNGESVGFAGSDQVFLVSVLCV